MTKLYAVPGATVSIDGHGYAHDQIGVDVPEEKVVEMLKNPALTTKKPEPPPAPKSEEPAAPAKTDPSKTPAKPKE